jgi:tetrahydromethanopterin S-methyltransferase subunit G
MEERIARMEGIYEQVRDRLNGIDVRLNGIDVRLTGIDARIADLENRMETRFGQIDQRFMWLTGIVIGTWITTILTILFHH